MRFAFRQLFLTIMATLAPAVAASAQTGIYVERYIPPAGNPCGTNPSSVGDGWFPVSGFPNRGSTCPGVSPQAGLPYGSNISFTGNSGTHYRIFAVSDLQPIGNITVSGSDYTLIVGRSTNSNPPFTNGAGPLVVAGGGAIGNISATGGTVQIYATDSVGTVNAATVVRVDATNAIGSVTSSSTIGTVRAPSLGAVAAASNITAVVVHNWNNGQSPQDFTGTISSDAGNIVNVDIRARFLGTVTADQGLITTVSSTVGIGPAAGSPVIIRAMDGINMVTAPSINANVTANASGNGAIRTFRATNGSISGSLQAAGLGELTDPASGLYVTNGLLNADITLGGNLWGDLSIAGAIPGGIAVPAGRTIKIGAGIQSPAPVTISGELQGQVIINSNNASQVWSGATTINGVSIAPSGNFEFSQTSADLGGGAIGMIPFRLWQSDSTPRA